MTAFLLSAFLFSCALGSNSGETEPGSPLANYFAERLDTHAAELRALPKSGPECSDLYANLYNKDTLAISIFLGFSESARTNVVMDGAFKEKFIEHLKKDCAENYFACGFKFAAGDSSTLTKSVEFHSETKGIILKIHSSAVSESYPACVGELRGEQFRASQFVMELYLDALTRDDVVLYAGHARYGAGPGFFPLPDISDIADNGPAIFFKRPLLSQVLDTLKNSTSRPAILGFFACCSKKFYAREIYSVSPRSALIVTSDLTPHENNFLGVQGLLNAILGMQSAENAGRSINSNPKTSDYHLYGFFGSLPHPNYGRYANVVHTSAAILCAPFLILLLLKMKPVAAVPVSISEILPGAGALILAPFPAIAIAQSFKGDVGLAFPVFFFLMGVFLFCAGLYRRETTIRGGFSFIKQSLPFLAGACLMACLIQFAVTFLPEISWDSGLAALAQCLKFAGIFVAVLPFVWYSEKILFAPWIERKLPGFLAAAACSLLFYFILYLAVFDFHSTFRPSLAGIVGYVLYRQSASFCLYLCKANMSAVIVFQALTLSWIFTEEIQIFLYG